MTSGRILVAIDASEASRAAAVAAAELAQALGCELVGLFVEDLDLLRLAELPVAVEADRLSARWRPCDPALLERQLRAQAARARTAFERAVAGRGLRSSFRVARGRTGAEILAAAVDADLVALGRVGFGGGSERVGSTARAVVSGRGGEVFVLRAPAAPSAWLEALRAALEASDASPAAGAAALVERLRERLSRLVAPVLLVR